MLSLTIVDFGDGIQASDFFYSSMVGLLDGVTPKFVSAYIVGLLDGVAPKFVSACVSFCDDLAID